MEISYRKWFNNQKSGLKEMETQGMLFGLSIKIHDQTFGAGFNLANQNDFSGYDTSWIDFSKYRVVVFASKNNEPLIKFVSGTEEGKLPHTYDEGSLCLYHPSEGVWTTKSLLSKDILPLIFTWVYFYEVWKIRGTWYGREFEH